MSQYKIEITSCHNCFKILNILLVDLNCIQMQKSNFTVGAFSVPFARPFDEDDDRVVPNFKSLKRFASILSDYGPFSLNFILPEEGQLGLLTETGYHDGVLGLVQEGKVDLCLLPLSLDTQKAPGYFTPVVSEENYYITSIRNLHTDDSAIVSSLTSVTVVPLLLAILTILVLELITIKHYKTEALITAVFRSFGISFYQNLSHSSWLCFIQMLILMFPVFIFNSAFSTQTIVGTVDYKIDTLRDVVNQRKIPFFLEGISMYDLFKAKVTKDYADVYERSVAAGFGEPFPLGPGPSFERNDLLLTFLSGIGRKLAPLDAASSDLLKPNQEQYFSAKPFHKSLQAMLVSYNTSKTSRKRVDTLSNRMVRSGIYKKMEADIYIDFILSVYPTSRYDFYKSQAPQKGDDLNWQSLNYNGFYQVLYLFILMLILSVAGLLIELIITFLVHSNYM